MLVKEEDEEVIIIVILITRKVEKKERVVEWCIRVELYIFDRCVRRNVMKHPSRRPLDFRGFLVFGFTLELFVEKKDFFSKD